MSKKPTIWTADAETDPFLHDRIPEPFVFGLYNGDDYIDFWSDECIDDFVEHLRLELSDGKHIIYFHNGGRFDLHFLLPYLEPDLMIIGGSIAKAKMGNIEFRDSLFILPAPLSAFEKDEIDYNMFESDQRNKPDNKIEIKKYLRSDCVYLHDKIIKFIERFGLHLTVASASFQQIKATGYDIPTTNPSYDNVFRPFYFGGRCEVFKAGVHKKDILYVDINSAYSFAMLHAHPYGTRYNRIHILPKYGVYFARIKAISYGALPHRTEDGLTFPNDSTVREYFASSWEIEAGIETGTLIIKHVIECIIHADKKDFKPFVDNFYNIKQDAVARGDNTTKLLTKFVLNAPYGKLALDPTKFKKYSLTPAGWLPAELVEYYQRYSVASISELEAAINNDATLSDFRRDKMIEKQCSWGVVSDTPFGLTIWSRNDAEDRYYNVATAASITGFVRAYLWRSICASRDVYYCDTDSIMCGEFSGSLGGELGQWSIDGELDRLYIAGKKLYAAKTRNGSLHYNGEGEPTRDNEAYNVWLKNNWKIASKGSRLTHWEIMEIVEQNKVVNWKNAAPSFSLRYGGRFITRDIKRTA